MRGNAKSYPWLPWAMILLGTCLMAIGIQNIYDPINLVTGGFTGISIIVKDISEEYLAGGIPLWLTNLVLNIPVFLVALKLKGKSFIGRTAVATILLSAWLYILPGKALVSDDYILAAVFGGVLNGVGIGMILRDGHGGGADPA